jgi:hypothetical protein
MEFPFRFATAALAALSLYACAGTAQTESHKLTVLHTQSVVVIVDRGLTARIDAKARSSTSHATRPGHCICSGTGRYA